MREARVGAADFAAVDPGTTLRRAGRPARRALQRRAWGTRRLHLDGLSHGAMVPPGMRRCPAGMSKKNGNSGNSDRQFV